MKLLFNLFLIFNLLLVGPALAGLAEGDVGNSCRAASNISEAIYSQPVIYVAYTSEVRHIGRQCMRRVQSCPS